jgi:hypothetical protein
MSTPTYVDRTCAPYVLADGDDDDVFVRCGDDGGGGGASQSVCASARVRLALARRRVEDAPDDPRAWYVFGAEAFAVGDFASCEFALTQACVRDAYGEGEPRLWLRLSHCALALNGDVRERVDSTLDALDGLDKTALEGVDTMPLRAMALDAALVEWEWARRQNREPRPRAKAILDGDGG